MNERERTDMQRRIDQGIILAQTRLIERAKREGGTLVVRRGNAILEVPANEL